MDGGSSSSGCPFLQRRTSTKRNFSAMSDTHRSASPDTLFVPQDEQYGHEHASYRRRVSGIALPRPPQHYAGDGLDFRRPVMSGEGSSNRTASRTMPSIIDLTNDMPEDDSLDDTPQPASAPAPHVSAEASHVQRLPRYDRNIIDVESEDEAAGNSEDSPGPPTFRDFLPPRGHRHSYHNPDHPRYSILRRPQRAHNSANSLNEVDLVEEQPTSRSNMTRPSTRTAPTQRSVTPYPTGVNNTIDLTMEDDDEVVHVDTQPRAQRGGLNMDRPGATGGLGTRSIVEDRLGAFGFPNIGNRLLQRLGMNNGERRAQQQTLQEVQREAQRDHARHQALEQLHRADREPRNIRFGPAPGRMGNQHGNLGGFLGVDFMDYDTPAFDFGFAGANQPAQPKYEPPEPVADGFTRSPGEDEVVVCPNCGDELAMGSTDEKQEVWVIKKCGHAYCGDCARNRPKTARKTPKKGKAKATEQADMTYCAVRGCGSTAAGKTAMVHVFIGS